MKLSECKKKKWFLPIASFKWPWTSFLCKTNLNKLHPGRKEGRVGTVPYGFSSAVLNIFFSNWWPTDQQMKGQTKINNRLLELTVQTERGLGTLGKVLRPVFCLYSGFRWNMFYFLKMTSNLKNKRKSKARFQIY